VTHRSGFEGNEAVEAREKPLYGIGRISIF
jgi:hypothetical protein